MTPEIIVAMVTAGGVLVTTAGAVIKQSRDIKELRKWLCTRNPCPDRVQGDDPAMTTL
jgi:hypothetical protein